MRALWLAVLAAMVSIACGPAPTLPREDTVPVPIGMIAPLSGELGADGPDWRDAVRLAVREVNSAGGVLPGRRVDLFIEDGESRTEQGVEAAERLMDDHGVVAIIGDSASSATLAVYEVTRPRSVLLASGLSTSARLTEINQQLEPTERFFFRTVPPDDRQAPALAEAMYNQGGCRNISILYANNDYGEPFQVQTTARFQELGGTVTPAAGVPYTEDGSTYRTEVTQIASLDPRPDCVALIGYPASAGIIMRDWFAVATMPETMQWFGTDGVRQPGFAEEVGNPELIDGFRGTAPVTDPDSPAYNRFEAQFQAAYGRMPVAFSSNLYDAAALVLLAIAKTGSIDDPDGIRDAIYTLNDPGGVVVQAGRLAEGLRLIRDGRAINYEGASGSVAIDANGDTEADYELWRYDAMLDVFRRETILE